MKNVLRDLEAKATYMFVVVMCCVEFTMCGWICSLEVLIWPRHSDITSWPTQCVNLCTWHTGSTILKWLHSWLVWTSNVFTKYLQLLIYWETLVLCVSRWQSKSFKYLNQFLGASWYFCSSTLALLKGPSLEHSQTHICNVNIMKGAIIVNLCVLLNEMELSLFEIHNRIRILEKYCFCCFVTEPKTLPAV